jgi:TIGR03009 family protein
MSTGRLTPVLRYIDKLSGADRICISDRQLLEQFVGRHDEAAFATLVRRHGPMVLGVCRRILRNLDDAEDAFQATFLLLVRKASSLRQPELLGPWLHGVAYRTALKARCLAFERRSREQRIADTPCFVPPDDRVWRDIRPVVDEAIRQLPAKYRVPFVLCYLDGMTNAQAARLLGCPLGTIATRLARARERLRVRLTRQGLNLSTGMLAMVLTKNQLSAMAPSALCRGAAQAATAYVAGEAFSSLISAKVMVLTKGVSKSMLMDKLRIVVIGLVACAAAGSGIGIWGYGSSAEESPTPEKVRTAETGQGAIQPPPVQLVDPTDAPGASVPFQTKNFIVHAPSRRIAQWIGDAAERERKELASLWLGRVLADWPQPCAVQVRITSIRGGSATTFAFEGRRIKSQSMTVEGSLDHILAHSLPHEITHTIFADIFGGPVPRWADEGAAIMSEDEPEQERHQRFAQEIVKTPGRAIPLRRLFAMQDYPKDVAACFAQGYSVSRFLVERKDRKVFLAFVKQGMQDRWDKAAEEYYGFPSVEALEDAWLAQLNLGRNKAVGDIKKGEFPILNSLEYQVPIMNEGVAVPIDPLRSPSSPMPVNVLAKMDKDSRVIFRWPITYYEPKTAWVKRGADETDQSVTTYVAMTREESRALDVAQVRVVGTDGKRIEAKALPGLLRKEIPVLVSYGGMKIDPMYLRVVKEDTLIFILPLEPAPAVPAPRPVPTAPWPIPPSGNPPDPQGLSSNELDGVLRRWHEAMSNLQTASCELKRTTVDKTFQTTEIYEGILHYMKPNLGVVEMHKRNEPRTFDKYVLNGNLLYVYSPKEKLIRAFELPLPSNHTDQAESLQSFILGMNLENIKKGYKLKLTKTDQWHVYLEITPRIAADRKAFQKARVVLSAESGLPRQLWFLEPNGTEITWDIPIFDNHVKLEPKAFTPSVPEGWRLQRMSGQKDASEKKEEKK